MYAASLRPMDRELLLGKTETASGVARSAKKSCNSPRSRSSVGAPDGRSSQRANAALAGRRDREDAPAPALGLARLGDQIQRRQPRRLGIQEGVRKRPEVAQRRAYMLLELVRRRGAFASEQTQHEIRRRRQPFY